MQQAMAPPLSREETIAVFGELAELGVLTPAFYSEAKDCILLAPPGAGDSLGRTAAMMKTISCARPRYGCNATLPPPTRNGHRPCGEVSARYTLCPPSRHFAAHDRRNRCRRGHAFSANPRDTHWLRRAAQPGAAGWHGALRLAGGWRHPHLFRRHDGRPRWQHRIGRASRIRR